MSRYKLTIAYEGAQYCGWQIQPNGPTIQKILQDKLTVMLRHPTAVTGAGRTDAGVHAIGQVAHFDHEGPLDPYRFLASINGLLPVDIRVKQIEQVPETFHARYSAKRKIYHYHLHLTPFHDPFNRLYRWHITGKMDMDALHCAAKEFLGTHDFTSFANEPRAGAVSRNPIRTLNRIDIVSEEGGICLEYEAESFLYKMVRNLTGTLVEMALRKRSPTEIAKILAAKDRRHAGKAAPPHGLFLMHIDYSDSF